MDWCERETIIYNLAELPFDDEGKVELIDSSKVRVRTPAYQYPCDIGSWCYTKRMKPFLNQTSSESCSIVKVVTDSFRADRRAFVAGFLEHINIQEKLGRAPATLSCHISVT